MLFLNDHKGGSINFLLSLVLNLFLFTSSIHALPLGFGPSTGQQRYHEIHQKPFYVYYNEKTPHEARLILDAFKQVDPIMHHWFGKHRTRPLPIIVSAHSSNPSFANLITDAIELQTRGQAHRDLVWHEYVHENMYRYFYNWLGPAGAVLHMAWLPSWFVEGLAESLSLSINSTLVASIESYYALTQSWPSYDKLHSLYTAENFSLAGYALSSQLVSYILRTHPQPKLTPLLNYYYEKSLPWYWPYALLPFKNSMPLDNTLSHFYKKNGAQFYEEYKKAAEDFWRHQRHGFIKPPDTYQDITTPQSIFTQKNKLYFIERQNNNYLIKQLQFGTSNWGDRTTIVHEIHEHSLAASPIIYGDHYRAYLIYSKNESGERFYTLKIVGKDNHTIVELPQRRGRGFQLTQTAQHLVWLEQDYENQRLCQIPLIAIKQADNTLQPNKLGLPQTHATCHESFRPPYSLHFLGQDQLSPDSDHSSSHDKIWFSIRLQTTQGDHFKLVSYNPDTGLYQDELISLNRSEPVSLISLNNELWIVVNEFNKQSLRHYQKEKDNWRCLKQVNFNNYLVKILPAHSQEIFMIIRYPSFTASTRVAVNTLSWQPCQQPTFHTSPLLYALNKQEPVSLSEALVNTQLWTHRDHGTTPSSSKTPPRKASPVKPGLGEQLKNQDIAPQPARWRARHVLTIPWIGADALGSQLGILSLPLMDHMQNEEVRLYLAYGLESRFPHQELTLLSSRFWPRWRLDIFRYQLWDGAYLNAETQKLSQAYLDQRGLRLSSRLYWHRSRVDMQAGFESSYMKRYIGPGKQGNHHIVFLETNKTGSVAGLTWVPALAAKWAPHSLQETFDYNQLALSSTLAKSFTNDQLFSFKLNLSRTRGKKRRRLQEVYRPLKIFIAGSGGGYNNLYFPIIDNGGLFSARYGDTAMRTEARYSIPIIAHADKVIRLIYWDRLTADMFVNYGGAWYDHSVPHEGDLMLAHGYNLNFLFNIKGFRFHLGTGIGQVVGKPFEAYTSASFDAIF